MSQVPADSDKEAVGQQGHGTAAPARTGVLMLGALGVVYGDIGTSPIYAFREALHASSGGGPADALDDARRPVAHRLGADDHRHRQIRRLRAARRQQGRGRHAVADGAGPRQPSRSARPRSSCIGVCGAALFFGDAIITPAISVLSAVEGLEVVAPGLRSLCRADHAGHPGDAFRGPALRHRPRGDRVRPGHRGLVPGARHCRPVAHLRRSGRAAGGQSRTMRSPISSASRTSPS